MMMEGQKRMKNTLYNHSIPQNIITFKTRISAELLLRKSSESAMEQKVNESPTTTSPQKHMKNRSKSTEEVQQTKKTISSQKSLPGRPELDKVKECPDSSEMPTSSTEELK